MNFKDTANYKYWKTRAHLVDAILKGHKLILNGTTLDTAFNVTDLSDDPSSYSISPKERLIRKNDTAILDALGDEVLHDGCTGIVERISFLEDSIEITIRCKFHLSLTVLPVHQCKEVVFADTKEPAFYKKQPYQYSPSEWVRDA